MLRILRAFAWMRWRIFINSLEKTGARDAVERFSQAIEHIAPILVATLMVPSALALAGIAGYAGYELATRGELSVAVRIVSGLLLVASILAIVGPLLMPAADRTNPVRLLLLPVPRGTLYVAQAAGALTDPWIMLLAPAVLALPVGMLLAGAPGAALAALAAGILVIAAIVAVSALTTTVIHLVLRDRRRGEMVALAFVLLLPLIGFIPASIASEHEWRRDRVRSGDQIEAQADMRQAPPSALARAARRAFRLLPSELYTSTIVGAAAGRERAAASGLGGLSLGAAGLHGLGLLLFGRVLAAPLTSGARRTVAAVGLWDRTIPGLSRGASAVALAQVRLALRSPRGRSTVLSPLLLFVLFALLMLKTGNLPFGPLRANGGIALAAFASAVSLLSIVPIALNQFAVDGAGLTLTLLSPLSSRQLLAGKAVGSGLVSITTALVCMVAAAVVFPGGSVGAWLSLVLSLVATYTLASPGAALFSALFPRVVDMNSVGRGSNAHGLASLLGLAAFALAALPCVALVAAARILGMPTAAPFLLLVWCAASFAAARGLFVPAARVFESRRENLAMLM